MTQPNKTIINSVSLDFAINHISYYYDTDFFPRAEEFLALTYYWTEVKEYLLESDLNQTLTAAPIVEPWPKVRGGYRVVHRLEPLDSLVYTALAKVVSAQVESSRVSPEIACSYRLTDELNSFFGDSSGFEVFRTRCEALAQTHPYVLCTDISDFYNKLYLHRLQNALQLATDEPVGISKRIEYFLTALNTKASQGIPVGPAASIVMSEAALTDVDKFLYSKGLEFVRYVDDFRIFGATKAQLESLLQILTLYLHENQRLSLNSAKTYILESSKFIADELQNQYQQEKLHILDELEGLDPYSTGLRRAQEEDANEQIDAEQLLLDALRKLLSHTVLDLGLVRAIVRRAKSNKVDGLAKLLLLNLNFLSPAINDIALYLDAVSTDDFLTTHKENFVLVCDDSSLNIRVVRIWMEWYFSRHKILLNEAKIRSFVYSSERLRPQAQAAITQGNESWIKERKTKLLHYSYWDRRSIILATSLLSKDERDKWLKPLINENKLGKVETWMARWVMEGSPKRNDFDDVIL